MNKELLVLIYKYTKHDCLVVSPDLEDIASGLVFGGPKIGFEFIDVIAHLPKKTWFTMKGHCDFILGLKNDLTTTV